MPFSSLRPCAGGCGARVVAGRCPSCSHHTEQRRDTSHERGYTTAGWFRFRQRFIIQLLDAGIPVVCGAALPDGPPTARFSLCTANGEMNSHRLELDHEPPLTDAERARAVQGDRSAFDDPRRVGFLCAACHKHKGDGAPNRTRPRLAPAGTRGTENVAR